VGADVDVEITATNTGDRAGKQVVQVYLSRADSEVDRPVRWLAGHAVVRAGAGESVRARVRVAGRAFAHWADGAWQYETGAFGLHVGTSVTDLVAEAKVELRTAVTDR